MPTATNLQQDVKFTKVVTLQYLVLLKICRAVVNVRDKNPLCGNILLSMMD